MRILDTSVSACGSRSLMLRCRLIRRPQQKAGAFRKTAIFLSEHLEVFHAVLARFPDSAIRCDLPEFRHGLATIIATLGGRAYLPAANSMARVLRFLKTGEYGRTTIGRVL